MNNNNILNNICINSDSYKQGHFKFMKHGTTSVFSYGEARKGAKFKETVFFGLQMYLKEYLTRQVTGEMIEQAERFVLAHGLPFNREGWEYILENHNGYLPLRICAVPEGTIVEEGNVLFTVENTDPNCAWASNFIETAILRAVWYGTTVATLSREFKKIILEFLNKTGTPELASFKLVDFGARGVSSFESSYIGGAAHLVNFAVTDNLVGIAAAMQFYNAINMPGFSIPASEHSVTTERGVDGEMEFFAEAIDTFLTAPGTMVSLVSDTYSLKNAIKIFGVDLIDKIKNSGGTVVVRPDSGVPDEMVLFTITELEKYFGTVINSKGYKVLPDCIRVIQGDGIDIDSIREIYEKLETNEYSADNLTLGCGGGLLQHVTRDTQRFAQKASHVVIDGIGNSICKIPETDPSKASKAGRLQLVKRDGKLLTIVEGDVLADDEIMLKVVYQDGLLLNFITFDDVRKNVGF